MLFGRRKVLFSAARIRQRVCALGDEITKAYPRDDQLMVVGLLKGSMLFMADLVREIDRPLRVDYIITRSYEDTFSTGKLDVRYMPDLWPGRNDLLQSHTHLVVVEDIIDSGLTLSELLPQIDKWGFSSVEICTLLHKRKTQPAIQQDGLHLQPVDDRVINPRWVGFECPDEFVVGYGMDHDEYHRNLPFIANKWRIS